jgi:hypothetical protein
MPLPWHWALPMITVSTESYDIVKGGSSRTFLYFKEEKKLMWDGDRVGRCTVGDYVG